MAMANTRNEEIRDIHKQYADFYRLGGNLLLVVVGVAIGAALFSGENPLYEDLTGYFTNLYTEAISVGLTILVLNNLQARRDKRNREEEIKEQLIREAGSRSHDTAIRAVDVMRKRGWLQGDDGILQSADLSYANLEDVSLYRANLQSVRLSRANLQGAYLWEANLQGAFVWKANLQDTNLELANLAGANLWEANLQGTNFVNADLKGAKLNNTNLEGANLREANLQSADFSLANLQGAKLVSARFC